MMNKRAKRSVENNILVEQILMRYQSSVRISQAINNYIGIAVAFTLTWVPYFVFVFLNIWNPQTAIGFFRQIYHLSLYVGFMFTAASINNKVTDIWVQQITNN